MNNTPQHHQQQGRSIKLVAQQAAVVAANTPRPTPVALRLDLLTSVRTAPCPRPAVSRITGLLKSTGAWPACAAHLGAAEKPFEGRLANAPNSSLLIECPMGDTMLLNNTYGLCLQAALVRTKRIVIIGTRKVEVFLDHAALPKLIDVYGMYEWGARGRSPSNTRALIHLSHAKAHGNALRHGALSIAGKLPYTVPLGAFGVVVYGCGASKVACSVVDGTGRNVCRLTEACESNRKQARAAMVRLLTVTPPCTVPPSQYSRGA